MKHLKSGEQFLHERDQNLHTSREVSDTVTYLQGNGFRIPNSPDARVAAYLDFLGDKDYVDDGILTGNEESIARQIEAHVINKDEIPEAYWQLQRQIVREQGFGDIELPTETINAEVERIQTEQRVSLAKWAEYVAGDGSYPDWFRYYSWEAVTKLGAFDKEKGEFTKRSKGTVAAYPELNREALAYVLDVITKHRLRGEETDDEALTQLLKGANFGKLYAHAIDEMAPIDPELLKSTEGMWVKYDQTSDPRVARRLSESLAGRNTGWCTAGESTAAAQLQHGDFHTYYTLDDKGKPTVPRLAIRMENGVVSYDVRGILPGQDVEPAFADILANKLVTLPGGNESAQKIADMKRITALEKRLKNNSEAELTKEDIVSLYELDHTIVGFGYEGRDPRIAELKALRGERDHGELARLLSEVLIAQARAAYDTYRDMAVQLGISDIMTEPGFAGLLERKEAEWHRSGVIDYLVRELVEKGSRPNLVAAPNVLADWEQVKELAVAFGEGQPYATYTYDNFLRLYSAEELSGKLTGDPVRLRIIPSAYNMEYGTVEEQREQLTIMKAAQSELGFGVPSPLEVVAFWDGLRRRDENVQGLDMTHIRHFDLPAVRLFDARSYCVPGSSVDTNGEAILANCSDVGCRSGGRVAVG